MDEWTIAFLNIYLGRGQLLIEDVFSEACHFNNFCWFQLGGFLANILKFLPSIVKHTNTRQHLWPGPLFLLKRPATFNSAVVWAISSKMQLSSSPDKHPQNISPFNSKPATLHMPSLSFIHSFMLHLSFSHVHRQMRFTLFTFFTLYPQHNQVSSFNICDKQLVQREIKKHKGIKSITTPYPL